MAFPPMYEEFEPTLSNNFSFTICVREFSNRSIHKSGQGVDLDFPWPEAIDDLLHRFKHASNRGIYRGELFVNGIDYANEGYLSILFETWPEEYCYLQCVVAVIDANGEKRFLRSFSFPFEFSGKRLHVIDRYIKRETLLKDSLELLPGDCLTLHIHLDMIYFRPISLDEYTINYFHRISQKVSESLTIKVFKEGERCCLSLDSEVFEKLSAESSYFQSMAELQMEEQRTRFMKIPNEEMPAFMYACHIVMGSTTIAFESIKDVCDIYVIAKKYFLPVVTENCRRAFVAILRSKEEEIAELYKDDLSLIYELAETYDDALLEKVLKRFDPSRDRIGHELEEDFENYLNTEWNVTLFRTPDKKHSVYTLLKNPENDENKNFYQ